MAIDELEELRAKRKRLIDDADVLEKSANEFSAKAETARSFSDAKAFIIESNSHRNTASSKRESAKAMVSSIEEKQELLKNM